jgi:hypothetical protein
MTRNPSRHSASPLRLRAACFLLLSVAAGIRVLPAQGNLQWSGYVVNLPMYEHVNQTLATLGSTDQRQWFDLTRVRLRPMLNLPMGSFVSLEYEISALYHGSPLQFPESGGLRNRQVVDLTWQPVNTSRLSVLHFVDRLFLRSISNWTDITLGRQRISWGTGRVWNPTDLFNPLNPTVFSKIEKDGVDAATLKVFLGAFSDATIVANPENHFRQANYGFRARTNVEEFDLSLMGGRFDDRLVLGGDFAGNLFEAGIRGEGIISASRHDLKSSFVKFILGADNQFTPELYALVEYLFNGQGTSDRSRYAIREVFGGTLLNVGRHYLAVSANYLLDPLLTATVSSTTSLTDGSGYMYALLSYSWTEALTVAVGGEYFHGDAFDEYWYYPDAVFLRGDVFF